MFSTQFTMNNKVYNVLYYKFHIANKFSKVGALFNFFDQPMVVVQIPEYK